MKIKSIEVCGFRGFRGEARFEFSSGLNVISGRNGVGKSAVCDALEFALTGELTKNDPDGKNAAKVQEYIWWRGNRPPQEAWVRLCLVDEDGRETVITRRKGEAVSRSEEIAGLVCTEPFPCPTDPLRVVARTSIIRDEHIALWSVDLTKERRFTFVREAIGITESPVLLSAAKEAVELAKSYVAVESERQGNARAALNTAIANLTAVQSEAGMDSDVTTSIRLFEQWLGPDYDPSSALLPQAEAAVGKARSKADRAKQAASRARVLADLVASISSPSFARELIEAENRYADLEREFNDAKVVVDKLANELQESRRLDSTATQLAQLIAHGEIIGLQDGCCPLCRAARSGSEFDDALNASRRLVETLSATAAEVAKRYAQASQVAARVQHDWSRALETLAGLKQRIEFAERSRDELVTEFAALGLKSGPENFGLISSFADAAREQLIQLELGYSRLRSSGALERITVASGRVELLREEAERADLEAQKAEDVLASAVRIRRSVESASNEMTSERLAGIAPILAQVYERLRPHLDWREIGYDVAGDVRRALSLTVGDGLDPQYVFSSGQRRAAGLAFLLAIHLSRPWCALKTLVLDDPVQHVDDFRALNLVEVLAAIHASGRQIIVTVEDGDLADLIARRVRSGTADQGTHFEIELAQSGGGRIRSVEQLSPLPSHTLRLVG